MFFLMFIKNFQAVKITSKKLLNWFHSKCSHIFSLSPPQQRYESTRDTCELQGKMFYFQANIFVLPTKPFFATNNTEHIKFYYTIIIFPHLAFLSSVTRSEMRREVQAYFCWTRKRLFHSFCEAFCRRTGS